MTTRTWVVVGASRGIGLEFVRQLLESGHNVVAAVRNVSAAPELFDLIRSEECEHRCIVEQCDISSNESIMASHDTTLLRGGKPTARPID